jgi:hypothetical protein
MLDGLEGSGGFGMEFVASPRKYSRHCGCSLPPDPRAWITAPKINENKKSDFPHYRHQEESTKWLIKTISL